MRYTPLLRAATSASASISTTSTTTNANTTLSRAARIAIVGAGPSGFYAASRLLSRIPHSQPLSIDIFDRLPVPHGLVRYGVAPDHPDVKNVEHKFATVSHDPRLRFAGNVNVIQSSPRSQNQEPCETRQYPDAVQLPLHILSRYYTHILFSYGASTARDLGIPGSNSGELQGVCSALEFVNWYNGHPASHDPTLVAKHMHVDLANKHHLTVIGAGNVALDVARIVLRSSTPFLEPCNTSRLTSNKAPGLAALEETDVPEPVLAELAKCKVKDVDIFARRGPAQLAFTNKEVREMLSLEQIALRKPEQELLDSALVQLDELAAKGASDPERAQDIASEVRVKKRLLSLLAKGSKTKVNGNGIANANANGDGIKTWGLNFFRSPAKFLPKEGSTRQVGRVEWNVTALSSGQPTPANLDAADPRKAAWGSDPSSVIAKSTVTGKTQTTNTDMIVSSVGYQSEPLYSPDTSMTTRSLVNKSSAVVVKEGKLIQLPFDSVRKIVPNLGGRVVDPSTNSIIPGVYVSGWLARGPNGVIATTMMDAYTVADTILSDLHSSFALIGKQREMQADLLQQLHKHSTQRVVDFQAWRRIDQEELKRGKKLGKLREKILTVKEMLDIVH
ncbi:related to NADPH:adrenodoxin oxidoreductase precursor, mitochondrial [Melanopsichium pennsylvanicum]|uniref:Related to NADPH:adrenodoxin oxidoreductase, mitochondrial n=2 Tax=Melanopsichium pennsylvanicum TaxID=63383 RepID=A0AAJ5C3B9_9BASI|nr:related to NADPH:adrenodoxin oxidoreductase precursor, mitochondrial [Melanopsichium pennsylvanicum 4]SNX82427.1 related to NADPH:adrenodoxin oxidoreductase precursor, mitochondrial [Melanopsichium pennsylvanicum]